MCYIYDIYSQPIHIIWYKWYWHNNCLEQYNTSNEIHINPAHSQPYPNPKYISINMWLWIQVPVRYPQVQECQLAPVHPWHAPTHESVPLWELHRRQPHTKEGPASLFMNWCEYWVHLINGCYEVPPFLISISFFVQVVHKDITKVFHCQLPRYFLHHSRTLAQCCIIIRTVTNTQRVKRNIELIGKVFTDINHWLLSIQTVTQ